MTSNFGPFSKANSEIKRPADLQQGRDDHKTNEHDPLLFKRSWRHCPSGMAVVLLIMLYTVSRGFANSTKTLLTKTIPDDVLEETSRTPEPSILFLIYCGGPSGYADMKAIQQTWGRTLTRVLILSNTPDDLPRPNITQWEQQNNITNTSWHISRSKILKDGGHRNSKQTWMETVYKVNKELQYDPSIQWIVRSDSDTWWNIPLLEESLLKTNVDDSSTTAILPPQEPLAMGQFYPLVNFRWLKEVIPERSHAPHLARSNGTDAYLSGGAGLIFTRKSMETLYACFPSLTLKSRGKEDIWFSRLAHACNVTLVQSRYMHQYPWDIHPDEIPSTLSVHQVAGDGRKGYAHPSYFEDALETYKKKQKNDQQ